MSAGGAKTAILTDIEGTTTDVAFVHKVLFPYAAKALPDFIRANRRKTAVAAEIRAVRDKLGGAPSLDVVIATLLKWIEEDRKETPLKALQGLAWAAGYESGELVSHVYRDAVACLRRWKAEGRDLYVYSSGSEAAQKLLFGHTKAGDLTPLFSGFFDTRVGGKLESKSYSVIAKKVGRAPASILFLSDHSGEIAAAREAGMKALRIDRARPAGSEPVEIDGQTVYGGFSRIEPDKW
jgi:enolase-phosphatase E1